MATRGSGSSRSSRNNGMMGSSSIGPERHHLARQVQAFKLHAKKLKKIFKETVKVLSDLQDFDESLSIDKILAVQVSTHHTLHTHTHTHTPHTHTPHTHTLHTHTHTHTHTLISYDTRPTVPTEYLVS